MPTLETINVGLAPNDKKGDPLRNAMQKVNLNFSALNTAIQGVLDGKGQANGYASLGADGRLLAAQAPIVYSAALPTTAHDLNTYVTPGTFYQTTVAGATAGANYPVLNVGFLEVVATGTPVLQVYTTRTNVLASMQRFWRVRQTAAPLWSPWKEVVDTSTAFSYRGGMIAAQDLNNYTQRGMWVVGSSATASGGTNYPIGQSGVLLVYSVSADAAPILTTGVVQVYYAANSNQTFTRSLVSTVWSAWARQVDANMMGAANGVATLNAASQVVQNPAPARALGASENLNDVTAPGSYYMNSNASATAALNYPVLLAGLLEVEAAVSGNVQVVQRYTTNPTTNPRLYVRIRFAATLVWGAWFELARADLAMTNVLLTAATDANTLTTANTSYSFRSGTVVSSGTNWPPISNISGGAVDVVVASDLVIQTATFTVSNGKPRIFSRYAISGVWQTWKILTPISTVGWLPTADAGDVYVDGLGWHRWNGTAYELMSYATTLPATAHDLNSYQTPGTYRQGTVAGASAGTNYPIAIGGYLEVISGGTGLTVQRYTVASTAPIAATGGGPRLFWRVAIGSTWGQWQEAATRDLAVTHTFLTAATDANTLTADNTFYTWAAAAYSAGANFPGYQAAGYMQVFWHSATNVSQEITLLVGGGKPLKFARFGNPSTGVWQSWKVTSAFNSTSWMPTSNMGDIYVDGEGWYAWNGSSYKLTFAGKDHGQCRFDYVSTTQCRLTPYNGNGLVINGRQYRIPSAGVNISNAAFTPQTLSYVYAYDNGSGVIALEASSTGYSSHTDGVVIKSGDPSRTLVGMAITPANGQFVYTNTVRYVTSYFNRRLMTIIQYVAASTSSMNNPVVLNDGCGCLVWGGSVQLHATGQVNANGSVGAYLSLRINSLAALGGWGYSCTAAGIQVPYAMVGPWYAAGGLITLQTYGYVNVAGYTINLTQDQGITYEG